MIEHCVNDEVLSPVFWEIVALKKKMEYASMVFNAIEEYVAQIFEIMEQRDDVLSDEQYGRLLKILQAEAAWLGDPVDRLLFWYDLLEKLKKASFQKS